MEPLFGAAGAEIFLLRDTKAERATSEVALGRLSLVGSQRKREITLSPGDSSSVFKQPSLRPAALGLHICLLQHLFWGGREGCFPENIN